MRSSSAPVSPLIINNALNLDTIHLICDMNLPKTDWGTWKKGKKAERVYTASTDLGEVRLVYSMKKFEAIYRCKLSIEFSATKVLYGENASTFHWDQLDELIARVKCIVESALKIPGIDIKKLKERRLDLNVDQIFAEHKDMTRQLDYMKKIYDGYIGYKEHRGTFYLYSCKSTAETKTINHAAVFKWYEKREEVKSRVDKGRADVSEIPKSDGIRYELTLPADRVKEVVNKVLSSKLKYVSLETFLKCDPKQIFSEGLRKFKGAELHLKHLSHSSLAKIKTDMLAAVKYYKKVDEFFDAIEKGDDTGPFKAQRKILNDLGYTESFFPDFVDFCDPILITTAII